MNDLDFYVFLLCMFCIFVALAFCCVHDQFYKSKDGYCKMRKIGFDPLGRY